MNELDCVDVSQRRLQTRLCFSVLPSPHFCPHSSIMASTAARSAGLASTSYGTYKPHSIDRTPHRARVRPLHAAALDTTNAAESGQSTWPGRPDKQVAKNDLLSWIEGTKRGSRATKLLRGQIEEAQVCGVTVCISSVLENYWSR